MPQRNGSSLLVILDNLDEFSAKLLTQIADESEEGSQQLILKIQQAYEQYNKPIEAHLSGWFYYFSRTRGPDVKQTIEDIKLVPQAINRLEHLKTLLEKGKWNEGSFNYCLFIELINGVPGYEVLDAKATPVVINRLQALLVTKIDHFINEFAANRRLVEEREKGRLAIQSAQKAVDNISVSADWISAQKTAKDSSDTISFCLVKRSQWQLSWYDREGTMFVLNPNQELLTLLTDQKVEEVGQLNTVLMKRLKRECLKIRDEFFEKIHLLINPKHSKTGAELDLSELVANGVNTSFIVRGEPTAYKLYWINTLGKFNEISLAHYPQLEAWLTSPEALNKEHLPQFKAYLSQISTATSIGMDAFKSKLEHCLSNRASAPHKERENTSKRLDLSLFADLERCIGKKPQKLSQPETEKSKDEFAAPKEAHAKLDLKKYGALTALFAHLPAKTEVLTESDPGVATWFDEEEPEVIQSYS